MNEKLWQSPNRIQSNFMQNISIPFIYKLILKEYLGVVSRQSHTNACVSLTIHYANAHIGIIIILLLLFSLLRHFLAI